MSKKLINTKNLRLIILFIACLGVSIWHETVSLKITSEGYYQGVVIGKAIDVGKRSSTHYLYINWDKIGKDAIQVHPVTYKLTQIGDNFSTEFNYIPILGASGAAYVPNGDKYVWYGVCGVIAKLIALYLLISFIVKRAKRRVYHTDAN